MASPGFQSLVLKHGNFSSVKKSDPGINASLAQLLGWGSVIHERNTSGQNVSEILMPKVWKIMKEMWPIEPETKSQDLDLDLDLCSTAVGASAPATALRYGQYPGSQRWIKHQPRSDDPPQAISHCCGLKYEPGHINSVSTAHSTASSKKLARALFSDTPKQSQPTGLRIRQRSSAPRPVKVKREPYLVEQPWPQDSYEEKAVRTMPAPNVSWISSALTFIGATSTPTLCHKGCSYPDFYLGPDTCVFSHCNDPAAKLLHKPSIRIGSLLFRLFDPIPIPRVADFYTKQGG